MSALEINELNIPGVFELRFPAVKDDRGFFLRTYDKALFREAGLHRDWVQENRSRNQHKGILRGLHFQFPPCAETKLVQCVRGEVFDVFVDLRLGSPSFGQWGAVTLAENRHNMVYIPRGFAHGYCTLSEVSEVLYKVDSPYAPENEGGLLWSDPDIGIEWPLATSPLLSEKDRTTPTLQEFTAKHRGLAVTTDA